MARRNEKVANFIDIDIDEIVRDESTDLAVLVRIDKDQKWIPRSIIEKMEPKQITVQEWWAVQEGFV
jgi:hypothetical protein